eukprot:3692584-Karenia_brevis.AAC.1
MRGAGILVSWIGYKGTYAFLTQWELRHIGTRMSYAPLGAVGDTPNWMVPRALANVRGCP